MASKKIPRLLARFFSRGQRTGVGNNMTKREERLHALFFAASAAWKCLRSHSSDKIKFRRPK
jgi:hypothetical protein